MKKLLLTLALLLSPTGAWAQCNGVFPNSTVCGNATGSSNTPRPTSPSAFQGSAGGTSGQTQYNNSGALGGYTPSGDVTVNTATGVETIQPGVVNSGKIATGGVATGNIAAGAVTSSKLATNALPTYASRAAAATLDLSGFTAIRTLGYTSGGDGGGATFKNITTNPVTDSFITTFTITGGSGYTNATYFGVIWTNTTKPNAIGYAIVTGNAVTTVNIAGIPGGTCKVGDVYTPTGITGGSGASITVTGCSTPLGSFTDTAGNHWQIVYDGDSPNIKQFGAVGDWAGTDGTATDNINSIQAALWFTGFMNGQSLTSGNGGFWGGRLWVPQGTFLSSCGAAPALVLPFGVTLEGASNQGSVIRMCDTYSGIQHFLWLCDLNWHAACLQTGLRNIQLSARASVASTNAYMVYSNNTQDFGGLDNVYIYAGTRGCVHFEKGYGGASTMNINRLSCTALSTNAMIWMGNTTGSGVNIGSTVLPMRDIVLGGPSGGGTYQTGPGILLNGGFPRIENVHCENMATCIEVQIPVTGNNDLVSIVNANNASTGAPAPTCTNVVLLDSTNTPLNTNINQIPIGGCTNTINNLQGGTNATTINVTKALTCPNAGVCN